MLISVKSGLSGDMTISSNLDIIDIDADLKEPQLCSIYAPDIYSNLRVAEVCITDTFLSFEQYSVLPFNHCHLLYLGFVILGLS
jgi:hypothetical protein